MSVDQDRATVDNLLVTSLHTSGRTNNEDQLARSGFGVVGRRFYEVDRSSRRVNPVTVFFTVFSSRTWAIRLTRRASSSKNVQMSAVRLMSHSTP